jgi:GNAT superfamily N-acetyltransferase
MHIERWEERAGFFGFFESLPEKEVVRALLEAARAWLHGRGMAIIRGPVSPSTNHECGLLVEGFGQPPRLLMPYNPPSYASLVEGVGFVQVKDLLSYDFDLSQALPERLSVLARDAEAKGARVRCLDLKAFPEEAQVMRMLFNSSWRQNWGFVPMSEAEAAFMATRLRLLLAPDLALIAEWGAKPVGFALSLPDYNPALRLLRGHTTPWGMLRFLWRRRSLDEMRVLALGILPDYRRRGIDALLIQETVERARRRGYRRAELSWILEENTVMRRTVEQLGGRVAKRYRLYEAAV